MNRPLCEASSSSSARRGPASRPCPSRSSCRREFATRPPAGAHRRSSRLRRVAGLGCRLVRCRFLRVELGPDQLDQRCFGAVATTVTQLQDACVAARPLHEARRQIGEELRDDVGVQDVLPDLTLRRQRLAPGLGRLDATLGHGDDLLDEGPQFLGLRHRGSEVLMGEQGLGLIAQQRNPMLGDPTQLAMSNSMTHGLFLLVLSCQPVRAPGPESRRPPS